MFFIYCSKQNSFSFFKKIVYAEALTHHLSRYNFICVTLNDVHVNA